MTIEVGYADGYPRRLGNAAYALVRGQRAPVIGRVCMDQAMLDVTDVPGAQPGDEVVLMGAQGAQKISDCMVHGQSITDPCLGWADTERLLLTIADRI